MGEAADAASAAKQTPKKASFFMVVISYSKLVSSQTSVFMM